MMARSPAGALLLMMIGSIPFMLSTRQAFAIESTTTLTETADGRRENSAGPKADEASETKEMQRSRDKERERDVLQMVDEHLPEIKALLDQLRTKEPAQYDLAIQNLAKSLRRLQIAKKRGQEAFEVEVQIIQAQSAINLLIAKLKVRDNKLDREALLEATRRFESAEIARQSYEVAQLQSRLTKTRELLEAAEKRLRQKQSQKDETVTKDFQAFLRKSGRK